jgi:hypothetical protein
VATAPLVEAVSADGRWALVGGNIDSGDYVYRQLYLLDLRRGAVHPIASPEGEGPATYP